jgi:hypothetical protein
MHINQVLELHYITPIATVPSILEYGILSHNRADKHTHTSVAMAEMQDIRAKVRLPDGTPTGRPLHEYANLYFHARNPMLFKRQNLHSSLCVLRISTGVLQLPGVVIADQNASSGYARFRDVSEGLPLLEHSMVYAESWLHPISAEYYHRKSVKCAEVLVPDRVAPSFVVGAYVSNTASQEQLRALAPSLAVVVESHLFFLPS